MLSENGSRNERLLGHDCMCVLQMSKICRCRFFQYQTVDLLLYKNVNARCGLSIINEQVLDGFTKQHEENEIVINQTSLLEFSSKDGIFNNYCIYLSRF